MIITFEYVAQLLKAFQEKYSDGHITMYLTSLIDERFEISGEYRNQFNTIEKATMFTGSFGQMIDYLEDEVMA